MTTSTTSNEIMGLEDAYANLHSHQERDYLMQRYHDVISSYGGNTSFFFSSRRRHTRWPRDWSSEVCSSDLKARTPEPGQGCSPCVASRVLSAPRDGPGSQLKGSQATSPKSRGSKEPALPPIHITQAPRSEERRVGKEPICRARRATAMERRT